MFFFFFEDHPYIAIIGDIKNSKKIEDRKKVQNKLKYVLEEVNRLYIDSIASKFNITLGDEFQGLLHAGKNTMEIIQYIKKELSPVTIRFGIGVGSISTDIDSEISFGADGPGYYMARKSIDNLKLLEKRNGKAMYDIEIRINGNNELQEESLNSIFKLLCSIESEWTEKQREIIYYLLFARTNQTETANHFNVTQSNIQQILAKSHYYVYKEVLDSVNRILSEVQYVT